MIRFFAQHPTAANLLMAIFLAAGILAMPQLRRETFPDITPKEVEIRVPYLGASAEEVDESICQRIEDVLDGIKFMEEIRSDAREGMGIVTAEMEENGDFVTFKDDISTEVDSITDFPDGAEDAIVTQLGTTDFVLSLLISGNMQPVDLKAYCEDLKDRLQRLDEVSLVKISGFSDHQFRIELSAEALKRYDLSVSQVAEIVTRQNVNSPAGTIETDENDILLRFVEERRSPLEFEDMVIKGDVAGAEVRLSDIGRVVDVFENDEQKVLAGTDLAGLLNIEKTKNQDLIRVADAVKAFLVDERERYPQVNLEISNDGSTLVFDRLQMLLKNGWQGMILVFLSLWLFFNVRLAFWVAMSLPVSFLGAFFFMPQLLLTINMMTMIGMLLALGLLMDDGIVIAENIATHRARGKSAMESAIDGVSEVAAGVISSFLTTVCVLGPLTMIGGDIGKVLKVVPIMLIVVMAISLVEAFWILPSHLGHALHKSSSTAGRFRRLFDGAIDWFREDVFGRAVDVTLRWRYLWLGTVLGVFLVSVSFVAGGWIKFQPFPDLDGDVLVARILLPAGTPLARTEDVVRQVTNGLDAVDEELTPEQPNGERLIQKYNVEFNKNTDAFETGPHVATITADLLNAEVRSTRLDDVVAAWKKAAGALPEIVSLTISEPGFGPSGRPIEVRFQGNDLARLKDVSTKVKDWFRQFKGVRNLSDDLRLGKPEFRLTLREGAFALGLDAATMSNQLRAAFQGVQADEIQIGSEAYEVNVQLNRDEQNSIADLEHFQFVLKDGQRVQIDAVTDIEASQGWSRIARVNGIRTATLRGDLDTRIVKSNELIAILRNEFLPSIQEQYPDVRVSFEGEVKEGGTTMKSMATAMAVGLIGVYVLLSFQFRTYGEPLIVMMAIPLALIGVIVGHMAIGIDLSMPSMMGFVSLAGVVVNDSILLVLFLKNEISGGANVMQAAAQASRKRFRAILLTSITTIAGLLPLLSERSLQAQVIIPLAVSIAFGLMASTVLVLLVIPSVYAILGDLGLLRNKDATEHEL